MVNDQGNNLTGTDPLFANLNRQDFRLQENSPLVNKGAAIPSPLLPNHQISSEYIKHEGMASRPILGILDIGAHEFNAPSITCLDTTTFIAGSWTNGAPHMEKSAIFQSNYETSNQGNIRACSCLIENGVI
jgi:hypothetical protein